MNERCPLPLYPRVPEPPRLLADAMLGKLARWLRLLGFDTRYVEGDDHRVAYLARSEVRVLLTMDRILADRRGLRTVLILSQSLEAQIEEVIDAVGVPPDSASPRCMACNAPLVEIAPEVARNRVPAYVARTYEVFNCCPKCGKIYWKGSHWQDMVSTYSCLARDVQKDS